MKLTTWMVALASAWVFTGCGIDDEGVEESDTSSASSGPRQRYIVVFKTDRAPADATTRITRAGGRAKRVIAGAGVATFEGTQAAAAALRSDPSVLEVGIEHVYRVPTPERRRVEPPIGQPTSEDFLWSYQWDIRRIGAPAVWDRPQPARRPRVAVLDTGVAIDHPDLAGQIVEEKAFTYCTPIAPQISVAYPAYDTLIDFTGDGFWDPTEGCTPAPLVYQSHGTHVAGTIAGRRGGGAIVGVAPNAEIGAYKVFDRYRYDDPDLGVVEDFGAFEGPLFAAIIDAADAGYPVINMSLGSEFDKRDGKAAWQAWKRVTNYAFSRGTLIVAAQGNSSLDLTGSLVNVPSDLPHVLGVSATGTNELLVDETNITLDAGPGSDVLAFYSNYGRPVDIAAPGGDCGPMFPEQCFGEHMILSAYIVEQDLDFGDGNILPAGTLDYAWFIGTSMASPHVAAVAAQVRAKHPQWGPGAARARVIQTAEHIGPKKLFGGGLVDADRATR